MNDSYKINAPYIEESLPNLAAKSFSKIYEVSYDNCVPLSNNYSLKTVKSANRNENVKIKPISYKGYNTENNILPPLLTPQSKRYECLSPNRSINMNTINFPLNSQFDYSIPTLSYSCPSITPLTQPKPNVYFEYNSNCFPAGAPPIIYRNLLNDVRDSIPVHVPKVSYLPVGTYEKIVEDFKANREEFGQIYQSEILKEKLTKRFEKKHTFRDQILKKWRYIRGIKNIMGFIKYIRIFNRCKQKLIKENASLTLSFKNNFQIIKKHIKDFPLTEKYIYKHFNYAFVYPSDGYKIRKKNTSAIVTGFLKLFFSELVDKMMDDKLYELPTRRILYDLISGETVFPMGFFSTFEFNRLEFNNQINLAFLSKERRGMIICLVVLYRIILIEVFSNFDNSFPKIYEENLNQEKMLKFIVDDYVKEMQRKGINLEGNETYNINISDEDKKRLKEKYTLQFSKKVINNFRFIINILHFIFFSAFNKYTPIYHDYFKENFIFHFAVPHKKKIKYYSKMDDFELGNGVVFDSTKTNYFIKDHKNLLDSFIYTTRRLCIDVSERLLEESKKDIKTKEIKLKKKILMGDKGETDPNNRRFFEIDLDLLKTNKDSIILDDDVY